MDFKRVRAWFKRVQVDWVAGSDFHDPGVGYLKESASGELIFIRDSRFADKKDRTLRIRMETKDGVTTSFAGPKDYSNKGLSQVEIQLFKARDSLFDEELYHEVQSLNVLGSCGSSRKKLV